MSTWIRITSYNSASYGLDHD